MYSAAIKRSTIDFVKQIGDGLVDAIADTNLFFPAVVAQKALESGYGKSELAKKYNNYGGIASTKMPGTGRVTLMTGAGYTKQFVTYNSINDFFKDYVRVLNLPNYVNAGVFEADSPEEQIRRIAKGGYDPSVPPAQYLAAMQPILDAARDIYQIGKISSKVPPPATKPSQYASSSSIMTGVMTTIANSMAAAGIKSQAQQLTSISDAKASLKNV